MTNKTTNKSVVKEEVKTNVAAPKNDTVGIAREMIRDARALTDPVSIFSELDKELKEFKESTGTDRDNKLKSINEKFGPATYIFALDNHYAASDTVRKEYKPMVIEIANQIIAEYQCKGASEKAVAELAASAYARYMQYAASFQNIANIEWLSSEKNGLYANYSKEVDRAHRQFMMAISTLKQMKSPAPQINVRTNTAFVAQNQQVNAVKEELPERKPL